MTNTQLTLFDLPTSPEAFSVLLPPSELNQIDFSALEYSTARRAVVEYIKTYFSDDFNDFMSNNGIIMLVELLSYLTAVLSMRGDILANEAFLPTAKTEAAVVNHLSLIGQKVKRATPAVADIECSVSAGVASDIHVPAGLSFSFTGESGDAVKYEMYRSPTDLTGDIVIPAGKRGVIAYGVEGSTQSSSATSTSAGQIISINTTSPILDDPITVEVVLGSTTYTWNRVDAIDAASAADRVYEARLYDKRADFVFGDNVNGMTPPTGATINITYRTGGGVRGRAGTGVINGSRLIAPNPPYSSPVIVSFTNIGPSSGGTDKESLDDAKKRAPLAFATHDSITTPLDYATTVASFSHPVFGSVAKSVATVRTSKNANLVELYILANGIDGPTTASEGLKRGVASYVSNLNVMTDSVSVLDAVLKPVDLDITIAMSRSADASVVKVKVDNAISNFFDIRNWDLGEAFYVSQLYDAINKVDGVKYIDIFKPTDNILATGTIATGSEESDGVGINELVVLGQNTVRYYYESAK